jgi:predicted nucleotidyltransferase component of viral defense system
VGTLQGWEKQLRELDIGVDSAYLLRVMHPLGPISDRDAVEVFHLAFLAGLGAASDKRPLVVKGGANLRFFFASPRYSEDMDFDVTAGFEPHQVRDRVEKILASPALKATLRTQGLSVARASAPKQTETTQRWKVGLDVVGRALPVATKLEFSHRGVTGEHKLDAVAREVAHAHGMVPPLAQHYLLPAAIAQKIRALAGRTETQARDVYDLDLLFSRAGPTLNAVLGSLKPWPRQAHERALALSFDDFVGQVGSFLPADAALNRNAWEAMQLRVAEILEEPPK